MPHDWKADLGNEKVPQKTWLKMPVIGMESEFNVWLDGKEINPEPYWKHPSAFIDVPLMHRTEKSSQLPTGGAVYFDRGVIEVVTPVIELAPGCSARVVRNLWEQIAFVREQLTNWERRTGHNVRLKAYSTHYNVSFELTQAEQNQHRNIQKLALLLAYILPVPAMIVAANRRSTGVGVRPRGNRIEITLDFTPDPGLMIAASTLIVGIVREVLSWPSYELDQIAAHGIPVVRDVVPGKHTTRKGWLTKDFHYPQSPYISDIDSPIWEASTGGKHSLREMALRTAFIFKKAIRRYADPFSFRLLFAILEGRAPSMLELNDRPIAYEDVGRLCKWGVVITELKDFEKEHMLIPVRQELWDGGTMAQHIESREHERGEYATTVTMAKRTARRQTDPKTPVEDVEPALPPAQIPQPRAQSLLPAQMKRKRKLRRKNDTLMLTPERSEYLDRRVVEGRGKPERRKKERRKNQYAVPFPDRRLTRSAYESVFLKLVSGLHLRIGGETYTPVGMKGWYHAIFRRDSDGMERLLTIDQLLKKMEDWQ